MKKFLMKRYTIFFYKYDWPGNTRELFNLLERGFAMSEKDRITVKEFEEMFMEILKTSQETEGQNSSDNKR